MSRNEHFQAGLQRAFDDHRENREIANEMGSWEHGDHWAPLRKSNIPADERDGWMFMGHETSAGPDRHGATMWNYKHGITRVNIHLDQFGKGYTYQSGRDGSALHYGPYGAQEVLRSKGHYNDLAKLNATPLTKYDDDYRAQRNAKLKAAGYHVIEG